MAVPTTTYDTAIPQAPSTDVDNFTYMEDESLHTAGYWAANDTSDGTRGRRYKDDDESELATDPIDFNDSAETGFRRSFIGTVLAASTAASRKIRAYPPNTANTAYGASDTYGSDNAYDSSVIAYLPMQAAFTDRTSNGNDGTGEGGISAGDSTGKFGNATVFDGSADNVTLVSVASLQITGDMSGFAWVNVDVTTKQLIFDKFWNGEYFFGINSARLIYTDSEFVSDENISGAATISTSTWYQIGFTRISGAVTGFIGGVAQDTSTQAGARDTSTEAVDMGSEDGSSNWLDGLGQDFQIHSTGRTQAWISEEFDQTNDNATFWGTWTNVPVGPTTGIAVLRRRMEDAA